MAGFADVAALAVAKLDLELVQLLRGAIRTADIEGRKAARGILLERDCFERRRHIEPEPKYEQRQVIHPEPRYLPRPIIHPTPRVENECEPPAAVPEGPPACHSSPIQPPWKQLAWTMPIPPKATIKITVYKTDIPHKGSLLDIFI